MPRRDDLKRIMLIGSGPIVIGQACEFDYSGTQGAKALRAEGYEIILVNSNPATIMTDPEIAERTYVEPLDVATVRAIVERERPDAILPTLGGQTALNLALALADEGTLERLGVELLGAKPASIRKAEDRRLFKEAMAKIGLECPRSGYAHSFDEAIEIVEKGTPESRGPTGYPVIVRPSFTLGGTGGGIAKDREELREKLAWALDQSKATEVLIEESILGWKEYELEVVRDRADNFIVVCSIENLDPMGVHTGDSITVAPAMTLTDREYQRLRDAAKAVMIEIGVDTGGSNVQFAVNPRDGRVVVIEMNPRVSRSSALASKATGYPIAKIATKLAVGYRLDELVNDITGTSAAFEPVIDYVVVKWPRFAFEKFPGADKRLGTQMKSVGEVMAIGRTFIQALEKAARSLEIGRDGMSSLMGVADYRALRRDPNSGRDLVMDAPQDPLEPTHAPLEGDELRDTLLDLAVIPGAERLFVVVDALRAGVSEEELSKRTAIDPWFMAQLGRIVATERTVDAGVLADRDRMWSLKRFGFSDSRIARLLAISEADVRAARLALGVRPVYARVDTCAAEFPAKTPYLYSTYEDESEAEPSDRKKVIILGGGPNRIGQGIEFDYCCVHAALALREAGVETVMVNCNPETVSTDYDTSDRLYFEPLTLEDVLSIVDEERSKGELLGVVVQLGGQTPLKLSQGLAKAGVPILGTSADAIDRAEDRGRFEELLTKLDIERPRGGIARGTEDAFRVAAEIGYPVVVRPSYVLGGRAMMICHEEADLRAYVHLAVEAAREAGTQTILVDEFLADAIELDVDAVGDGESIVIGGIMQHIEEAGIHSGDSASVLPPHSLARFVVDKIVDETRRLGMELGVVGLMNVQFAVKNGVPYVIEVNPRGSRTVPFVSKATGRPLAKIAVRAMLSKRGLGPTLREQKVEDMDRAAKHVAVKESVFPFAKFPGVDTQLGPEMRSTGEVMGIASNLALAFGKAQIGAGTILPSGGRAFISVKESDKEASCEVARRLFDLGFEILATTGTAEVFGENGIDATIVKKVREGSPHIVDRIRAGEVAMVVNTTVGARSIRDSYSIRRQTLLSNVPVFTTIAAALAAVEAIDARARGETELRCLQEWYQQA